MKRLLPLLGVAALVSVLAACGGGSKSPTTTSSKAAVPTKTPGKLVVGFDVPAPAFWNGQLSRQHDQAPDGLRVRTGARHREAARHQREQRDVPACAVRRASSSPAASRTTSRWRRRRSRPSARRSIGFSSPYFDANQGVLIAKGVKKPTTIADLKRLKRAHRRTRRASTRIQHKLRPAKKPLVYSASSTPRSTRWRSGACDALILDVPIVVRRTRRSRARTAASSGRSSRRRATARYEKGSPLNPYVDKAIKALQGKRNDRQADEAMAGYTREGPGPDSRRDWRGAAEVGMGKFLHAFFSPLGFRRAVPQVWDGFQTNIKLMVVAETFVLVLALAVAIVRGLPGRGAVPFRAARDRLHGLLPRHAADPRPSSSPRDSRRSTSRSSRASRSSRNGVDRARRSSTPRT